MSFIYVCSKCKKKLVSHTGRMVNINKFYILCEECFKEGLKFHKNELKNR